MASGQRRSRSRSRPCSSDPDHLAGGLGPLAVGAFGGGPSASGPRANALKCHPPSFGSVSQVLPPSPLRASRLGAYVDVYSHPPTRRTCRAGGDFAPVQVFPSAERSVTFVVV